MEKVEKLSKKRNLEGNSLQPNMFSALPFEDFLNFSNAMGVSVEDNDFATFDLLKDLDSWVF